MISDLKFHISEKRKSQISEKKEKKNFRFEISDLKFRIG